MKVSIFTTLLSLVVLINFTGCQLLMEYEAKRVQNNKIEAKAQKKAIKEKEAEKSTNVVKDTKLAEKPFDPYLGLDFPTMPKTVELKADLDAIVLKYSIFIESQKTLATDVKAYGIAKNKDNIQRLVEGTKKWADYFTHLYIAPNQPKLVQSDLKGFYASIESRDQVSNDLQKSLNAEIDKDRSRPYTASK